MTDSQQQIIELSRHPINYGQIEDAEIIKIGKNLSCGDQVNVFIKLGAPSPSSSPSGRGRIEKVMFEGNGCSISIASASLLTKALIGKTLEEVKNMTVDDVQKIIGMDLGPSRLKCAFLPLDTIQQGIKEYEGK